MTILKCHVSKTAHFCCIPNHALFLLVKHHCAFSARIWSVAHPRFLLLFCLPHIPAYSVLPSGKVPRDHLSLSFSPSYLTLQCHQNDHSKPVVPSTTCAQNPCKWLITDGLNCFSPEKKTFTVWVIFPALQTHTDTACSLLPHFTLQVFGVFMVSPRAVPCLHWTLQLSTSSSCVCTA